MKFVVLSTVVILSPFAALRAGSAKDLFAQVSGQSFEVVPESASATVGDSITLGFRVRLHERDMLLDTVPRPLEDLPPGVRLLSVEKLTRAADRVYEGKARIAFYRPGRRAVPGFGLQFMRVVEGVTRATLASDSAFIEIRPVLPAGNPPLKDIKESEPTQRSRLVPIGVVLALVAAGLLYRLIHRRRRPPPISIRPEPPAEPAAPTPYQVAMDRLKAVEGERWPLRGKVAAHYEAVAQTLRQYLEDAENVAACERTTSELLWALPPHLTAGGLRNRCHDLLADADLVKFAEVRPSDASATGFLAEARQLLLDWHQARPAQEGEHALR